MKGRPASFLTNDALIPWKSCSKSCLLIFSFVPWQGCFSRAGYSVLLYSLYSLPDSRGFLPLSLRSPCEIGPDTWHSVPCSQSKAIGGFFGMIFLQADSTTRWLTSSMLYHNTCTIPAAATTLTHGATQQDRTVDKADPPSRFWVRTIGHRKYCDHSPHARKFAQISAITALRRSGARLKTARIKNGGICPRPRERVPLNMCVENNNLGVGLV